MSPAIRSSGILSLTGVRGIAAVWVLLFHIQGNAAILGIPWLRGLPLLRDGWRGVDLFFILSGFVLMYVHEQDFVTLRHAAILRFAELRFFRIYPLSAVVLGLIALLVLFDPSFAVWYRAQVGNPENFTAFAFFKTLFLATRWFLPGRGEWNEPVWSLSVEVLGYAAFPIIAWYLARCRSVQACFGVAFVSLMGLTLAAIVAGVIDVNVIGRFSIVRMAGCFIAGAALCRAWRLIVASPRLWPGGLLASCCCLGLLFSCTVPHAGIFTPFGMAGLIFALAFQQGVVNRVLASKPAVFLGKISFPLYLIHVVPMFWWGYWFSPIGLNATVLVLIYIALCILTATVLHYSIERPVHALGRRWIERGNGNIIPVGVPATEMT